MEYCTCVLPLKMTRKAADAFKIWYCASCEQPVDPKSKMLDKHIEPLPLHKDWSAVINKINEILELLKANGSII